MYRKVLIGGLEVSLSVTFLCEFIFSGFLFQFPLLIQLIPYLYSGCSHAAYSHLLKYYQFADISRTVCNTFVNITLVLCDVARLCSN
jgi:hypothetical protein